MRIYDLPMTVKVLAAVCATVPLREPERNFIQPTCDGTRSTLITVPGTTLSETSRPVWIDQIAERDVVMRDLKRQQAGVHATGI